MSEQALDIGSHVIFCDEKGQDHNALVTCVWDEATINVAYVSSDKRRDDSYGRQIERTTSVSHVSQTAVHGFYWRRPSEEPNPRKAPQKK